MKGDPIQKSARLQKIATLLCCSPIGLTARELADRCGVTIRTIERDLDIVDVELGVPVIPDGNRYRASAPPPFQLRLTLHEAMVLLIAARLYARNSDERNPHADTALAQLARCLHGPMAEEVRRTAMGMAGARENKAFVEAIEALALGWFRSRKVRLGYRSLQNEEVHEHVFSPYFIEAAGVSRSTYAIGRIDSYDEVRTLKVERVVYAEVTGETFELPAEPDFTKLLESAWGVMWGDGNMMEVKLRFAPEGVRALKETVWHFSQETAECDDGSCLLTVRVGDTREMESWILGWGSKVEVVSPIELREKIAGEIKRAADKYEAAR